jgi:hypothetical protein
LRERGPRFLADLYYLVAFAAADTARVAFDLEPAVRPEIGWSVDELARVEGDLSEAII